MTDVSTFVDLLRWRAQHDCDQLAFCFLENDKEAGQLSYGELDRRARAIAVTLRRSAPAGALAILLYPAGLAFVESFFGCLYAGIVAIPAPPIDYSRRKATLPRLQAIVRDSGAKLILGPARVLRELERWRAEMPELEHVQCISTDMWDLGLCDAWQAPDVTPETLAYLQYTSGSTSSPKGVMISHANLVHNCRFFTRALKTDARTVGLTWLPHFHDYGLVAGLMHPVHAGFPAYLMSPLEFVKYPVHWLRAISRYRVTVTGAPTFAYEHCLRRISEAERASLDLGNWRVSSVGAEYVHLETLDRFAEAFASCGFRKETFYPGYGLAEATLIVALKNDARQSPSALWVDGSALEDRRVVEVTPDHPRARPITNCCAPGLDTSLVIVNPETRERCRDGEIGEVWVASPSVSRGYWKRPAETEGTFRCHLADTGEGPFLRTGDLGFLHGGELFFCGRLKDLIIIGGANHYPEDLERTVADAHPAFAYHRTAAFSVEGDREERVVIAQEIDQKQLRNHDPESLFRAIRLAVSEAHELTVHAILLVKAGGIPRTSSNKVQRSACAELFLSDEFTVLARWTRLEHVADGAPALAGAPPTVAPAQDRAIAAEPAVDTSEDARAIRAWLTELVSRELRVEPAAIDPRTPLAAYGMSSVNAVSLVGAVQARAGRAVPATLLYECPTLDALASYLLGDAPAARPAAAQTPAGDEPIAIIGIGARLPGRVNGAEDLWRLLCDGGDAVTEVPADRWRVDAVYDPDPGAPGKTTSRWGGFVEQVDAFDPYFFGISPREAIRMDPQQRLMLEVTQEALDDAGLPRETLAGSATGVFVGLLESEYAWLSLADRAGADAYTATGNSGALAANRISYVYDLRGPSFTVDAVCSSSLLAVHLACQSLARGECGLALVGGVQLLLTPEGNIWFSKLGVLSPEGRCKAFDARGNGIVLSEGAAMVVLKPLSRAIADGDRIYAQIRGSAVSQDGRSNGLTAPTRAAQEAMLRDAYRRAGIAPDRVHYVDAHGTGTVLGDPIEAQALGAVLGDGRDPERPCYIGSLKTNLGHLGAVGGIASLLKVALSIQHRKLPASLHFAEVNPYIPMSELKLKVPDALIPWPYDEPAVAGVTSLSFGGTNVHVVVEEASRRAELSREVPGAAMPAHLLTLSAHNAEALGARARDLAPAIARLASDHDLERLCYASTVRQSHHDHRLAVVCGSQDELERQIAGFVRGEREHGVFSGHVDASRARGGVVFVFPGQGSQSEDMGRALLETEPVFRAHIEQCDALIREEAGWSLLDEVYGASPSQRRDEVWIIQPALFALQVALAAQWGAWGIEPAAVLGHSVGEIAAAHVAGALDLRSAVRVVCKRGQVLRAVEGIGAMAMVGMTEAEAESILGNHEARVGVAAINGARSLVLSGDATGIDEIVQRCQERGVFCRRLQVTFAGHSHHIDALRPAFVAALAGLSAAAPRMPYFSAVTGGRWNGGALDAEYWSQNIRQTVRFAPALRACAALGHGTFLELGPHPSLRVAIQEELAAGDPGVTVLGSLSRAEPARRTMLQSLAALYIGGEAVAWRAVQPAQASFPRLPGYPWQRQRLWLPDTTDTSALNRGGSRPERAGDRSGGHPILGGYLAPAAEAGKHYWAQAISAGDLPYLADHRIEGAIVFPGAGYLELALAGARHALGAGPYELADVRFQKPLRVPEQGEVDIQLCLSDDGVGRAEFEIFGLVRGPSEASWTTHAAGQVRRLRPDAGTSASRRVALGDIHARCATPLLADVHYASLAERGGHYGPAFRRISELQKGEAEAIGRLTLPDASAGAAGAYLIHPCLLDAAFQLAFAALPDAAVPGLFVPAGVQSLRWFGSPAAAVYGHAVHRADQAANGRFVADVAIYDGEGRVLVEAAGLSFVDIARLGAGDIGDTLLDLAWQPAPADEMARAADLAGTWIVFADRDGVGQAIGAALVARGARAVQVRPADSYARVEPDVVELSSTHPDHFDRLLAELMARGERCRGVVYLWGLAAPSAAPETLAGLEQAQRLGLVGALHLVQTLIRARLAAPPALWLVTGGAQVIGDDPAAPAIGQAPLWALGKVIAFEHPELCCTRIDLLPAEPTVMAAELLDALERGGEREVAIRDGQRFVPALRSGRERREAQGGGAQSGAPGTPTPAGDRPFCVVLPTPGRLDDVAIHETFRAAPRADEVEIEVRAVGLNFLDVVRGVGLIPDLLPADRALAIGMECSGRVVSVGRDVTSLRVGDDVMAVLPEPGTCRSHAITRAALAVRMPSGVSFEQAATLPIAFLTVLYGLEQLAQLERGERVLIHAASGGVGLAAVQVARAAGAEIFATAGNDTKRRFLRDLGIEHVMDSRSTSFADEILERTGGRGVDVVLNSLSGAFLARSLATLAPFGRFVELGKRDIHGNSRLELGPFRKNLAFFSADAARLIRERPARANAWLGTITERVERGIYAPLHASVLPVVDTARGLREMAQARHIGKVVISLHDRAAVPIADTPALFRRDATYLITGGLGGIGLAVAQWMAARGAAQLVLLGRQGPSPRAREVVEALERDGVSVTIVSGDVTSAEQLGAVLADIRQDLPPLRGVFHTAGALDDGLLVQLDQERLLTVLAPKLAGAWNLHTLTRGDALDHFVLFSSTASLLGSPGQGNYSAANGFLDALARYRRAAGLPGLSINWGPWADVGGVAQAGLQRRFAARGQGSITSEQGIAALEHLMRRGATQMAVVRFDARQWASNHPEVPKRFVRDLLAAHEPPSAAGAHEPSIRQRLIAAETAEQRAALITACVRTETATVLGIPLVRLEAMGTALGALGMDSLMGLELRNRLEKRLDLRLPSTLVWNCPTFRELTEYLLGRLELPPPSPGAGTAARAPDATARPPQPHPAPPAPDPERTGTDRAAAPQGIDPARLETMARQELEALLDSRLAAFDDIPEGK